MRSTGLADRTLLSILHQLGSSTKEIQGIMSEQQSKSSRRKKKSGQGKGGGQQKTAAKPDLASVLPAQNPNLIANISSGTSKQPLKVDDAKKELSNNLPSEAPKPQTQGNQQQTTSKRENKLLKDTSSDKELSRNCPATASKEKLESKTVNCPCTEEVVTVNKKIAHSNKSKDVPGDPQTTKSACKEKIGIQQSVDQIQASLEKTVITKQTIQGNAGCPSTEEVVTVNKKLAHSNKSKDVSGEPQTTKSACKEKIGTQQSVDQIQTSLEKTVITKQPSQEGTAPVKSKAELRAERRAVQEAQRAAKQGKKVEASGTKTSASSSAAIGVKPALQAQNKQTSSTPVVKGAVVKPVASTALSKSTPVKQVKLFSHLPPYTRNISVIQAAKDGIHPAVVRLGLQYAEGIICGSNARCAALIHALLEVIQDFKTPESKDFSHALNSMHIEKSMKFLHKCRPVSVGMQVVCTKLMEKISELPKDLTEEEAKKQSQEILYNILEDDIIKAHTAIITLARNKISANDVILTYGCSYLVKEVLVAAHQKIKFRVVIVDSRPKLEGKSLLHSLIKEGIECTYVLINAVAHVMQEVSKVFLGAHALMANGYVMSRVGSSQVALVAKAFNKPVLVCCETYKFSEMVQTDSFVFNELGNPVDLVETHRVANPLSDWQAMKSLNILNLYYDVTPPDLVTVIVNDVHLVPCTSVPVLLRVKPNKK